MGEATEDRGCEASKLGASRKEMDAALRAATDRHLRPIGFKGSIPHLRRSGSDRIELLSIQHFSGGGRFAVNVACSPPDGLIVAGARIGPRAISANHINGPRPRLGSERFPKGDDNWFVYGPRSYDDVVSQNYASPEQLASEVVRLIREQAEPWWSTRPFPPGAT